jgi:hypothetical protein
VLAFAGVGLDHLVESSDDMQSATSAGGSADEAAPMMESQSLVSVPAGDRIVTSGTDYTEPTLGGAPAIAMAQPGAEDRGSREAASPRPALGAGADLENDPLGRLRPPEALLACLEAIARERGGNPIIVETVDYARFEGAPALIVRFVADGVTWAWATGPECGAPDRGADSLGTLRVG